MAFDRSKYAGTPVSKLNEKEEEVKSKVPQQADNGRADFHTLEMGKNYFRIYPSREGEDTYAYPKTVHWLPQIVEEKDAKTGKVKKVTKRKPVFNAKVHGDLPFDLVEEFVKVATRLVKEQTEDEEEQKKRIWPLISWQDGVNAQTNWVMYADKHSDSKNNKDTKKVFGRLEIWDTIYKEMKKRAAAMDDDDDSIADPFSDPDNGKLLVITKEAKEVNGKTKNDFSTDINFQRDYALSDDSLIKFEEFEPLSKLLTKCFKRSDFEKQIEGLRLLDEDNSYGVFDDTEFISVLDEMDSLVPVEEEKEEKDEKSTKPPVKATTKPVVKTPPATTSTKAKAESRKDLLDEFDGMDRAGLKKVIAQKQLPIKVLTNMTDDVLRAKIREELAVIAAHAAAEVEEEEEEEEAGEEATDDSGVDDEINRVVEGKEAEEDDEEDLDEKMKKYNQGKGKK